MADHVFPASLSVTHVHFLSRCVPNHSFGSEMKLRLATLGLMLLLWAAPAFSQGCAMCYSNATGTTKEGQRAISRGRSEEHTSELQSRGHLVCRLLLEKKKNRGRKC